MSVENGAYSKDQKQWLLMGGYIENGILNSLLVEKPHGTASIENYMETFEKRTPLCPRYYNTFY